MAEVDVLLNPTFCNEQFETIPVADEDARRYLRFKAGVGLFDVYRAKGDNISTALMKALEAELGIHRQDDSNAG